MQKLKKILLLATVFITGACVLIIELVATRILSPYFGNTIYSYSSVITVILAALSLGYYLGGKLADKKPTLVWFYSIILLSGITVFILQILIIKFLPLLGYRLSLVNGPLITSLILFLAPAFFLGTLSPYAIKLLEHSRPETGIGSISGEVFFWSTLGSISGSLSAGFLLIPNFGISNIILSTGLILIILGAVGLFASRLDKKITLTLTIFCFAVFLSASIFTRLSVNRDLIYYQDGVYERIVIADGVEAGHRTRYLFQDRSFSTAMFLDSDDLVFEYSKYYDLYQIFSPDAKNILVLGGGAYTVPKAYFKALPAAQIDVSEIEPNLFELAKQYFNVPDSPRLKNYLKDGRRFLHDSKNRYDIIFGDVFHFSIPVHFTTQEFFNSVKSKLSENGVYIVNIIGSANTPPPSFLYSEMKTFASVFANSYFFAVSSPTSTRPQNFIFVGYNSDKIIDFKTAKLPAGDFFTTLPNRLINTETIDFSQYPLLTDNYAPVEYLIAATLRQY